MKPNASLINLSTILFDLFRPFLKQQPTEEADLKVSSNLIFNCKIAINITTNVKDVETWANRNKEELLGLNPLSDT